jgi:hypothetical protein
MLPCSIRLDAGFDHTVLSEFRTRLVEGKLELVLFDVLLERAGSGAAEAPW